MQGHIQRSVLINAPVEEVYKLLVTPGRYGEWVAGFAGLDEGPGEQLAQGTTLRWRMRQLPGLTRKRRGTVSLVEPPHRCRIELQGFGRPTLTQTVSAQKRRTQLSWTLNYRVPGGPLGKALDWLLLRRRANHLVEQSLRGAKTLLEAAKQEPARGGYRRQTAVR